MKGYMTIHTGPSGQQYDDSKRGRPPNWFLEKNKVSTVYDAIREFIKYLNIANNLVGGNDISRNYKFGELLTEECIQKYDKTYHNKTHDHKGSHGPDFINSRTTEGEDKSSSNIKIMKNKKIWEN